MTVVTCERCQKQVFEVALPTHAALNHGAARPGNPEALVKARAVRAERISAKRIQAEALDLAWNGKARS